MARTTKTERIVLDLPNEEWSAIDGYTQIYMVSNLGRVKTFNIYTGREYCLKPQICGGYQFVRLYTADGKGHTQYIHRLVASAFCEGRSDTRKYIDHTDTIRTHNVHSNIKWCTASENSNNPLTIIKTSCQVNQLTLSGDFIQRWDSIKSASRNYGVIDYHITKAYRSESHEWNNYLWMPFQQRIAPVAIERSI